MNPTKRVGRSLAIAWAAAFATIACSTSVPFDHPKEPSQAIPLTAETELGEFAAAWQREHPGQTGFYLIDDGLDALGARLRLMALAQRSIDAQYFLLKGDASTELFAGELWEAAERGVRVRLLVDDLFTALGSSRDFDEGMAALNLHPNIELRLFNPIARGGILGLNYVLDFERANRRMHNKSLTADGAVTIVGGRNIGDEYFRIHEGSDFADLDVLVFGPPVAEVGAAFDDFWNSALSVPMEAVAEPPQGMKAEAFGEELLAASRDEDDGTYAAAVTSDYLDDVFEGRIDPFVAPARFVSDRAEKLETPISEEMMDVGVALQQAAEAAREELVLITPYYIPGDEGVAFLRELIARGVRVVVVTNSLAATNHAAVHSAYGPYRKPLLDAGVELYEVRSHPDRGTITTLHTKAMLIDRETLFVGSPNLDPRSIEINTEKGIFFESPAAGAAVGELLDESIPEDTYRVKLDEDRDLVWEDHAGDEVVELHREPDTSWWRRFQVGLYRLLPLEDQL